MSKKTYADECLERAEKATIGPWIYDLGNGEVETSEHRVTICNRAGNLERKQDVEHRYGDEIPLEVIKLLQADNNDDMEFIAHARTDVPELARRLNEAIRLLKQLNCHPDCIKVLESKPGEEILVTVNHGCSAVVQLTTPGENENE
jgi:hypothetical protein